MKDIVENHFFHWEYCNDPDIQYINCPPPRPVKNFMPHWYKNLKGNMDHYDSNNGFDKTVRHCIGLRGLVDIGYTIPLPETLDGYDTKFSQGRLHPEMLHGTKWANKGTKPWTNDDFSLYEYRLRLLHWPWRAKMARGWRLIILPYLLDWNDNWNEFAGAPTPSYDLHDVNNIGSYLMFDQPINSRYNYYNLESVVAYKRSVNIEKGTLVFCAVPYYDIELYQKQEGIKNDQLD